MSIANLNNATVLVGTCGGAITAVPAACSISVIGSNVFFKLSPVTGTQNVVSPLIFSQKLSPTPATDLSIPIWVFTNGTMPVIGNCIVTSSGELRIYKSVLGNFTGGDNNIGFYEFSGYYTTLPI